jgi:hypothetical protein
MKGYLVYSIGGLLYLFAAVDAFVSIKWTSAFCQVRSFCRDFCCQQRRTAIPCAANEMSNTLSRRQWWANVVPTAILILHPVPAISAEEKVTVNAIRDAFQGVRDELLNVKGGVSVLSRYVDQQDYGNIMEFTKTYDQILRKGKMGKAKKLLLSYLEDNETLKKRIGERATQIANAITFDLIGLNRSSRSGRESAVDAKKYLEELQSDLLEFLTLEDELLPS